MTKKRPVEEFKAVVYESYKPKAKKEKLEQNSQKDVTKSKEIDMKRARHEIVKFGMSGFDPEKKEQAKVQLAIRLGAKPPKNKYKNYKELKEEKRKQIERRKEEVEFQQLGKNVFGKSNAKGKGFDRKRKNGKGALLDKYGKVRFRCEQMLND